MANLPTKPSSGALDEAQALEVQAADLFGQRKVEEAFQAYNEVALLYRGEYQYLRAAQCFARAAYCEKLRAGLENLREAAALSEYAADEAVKAGAYEYARWLYREAGLLYEREGEFDHYSHCFVSAQETYLKYLWMVLSKGLKPFKDPKKEPARAGIKDRLTAGLNLMLGFISKCVWGYGEYPFRPFFVAIGMILGCAVIYHTHGTAYYLGQLIELRFPDAVYMSGITFSTVGYGDFSPAGWTRYLAILEGISGLFIIPLFIVSLTRRYLRVYR